MHKSQLGKFAPAIVTTGSHAVKVTIDRQAASLKVLASRDDRIVTGMFYTKNVRRAAPVSAFPRILLVRFVAGDSEACVVRKSSETRAC
jgi:hypothetical protein